jgi:hypothetical protein
MPELTVTFAALNAGTKRTSGALKYLGHRSSALRAMLQKLDLYEKSGGDGEADALALLKAAARLWRRNHPKEFANRDELSGGLCSKLLRELAIPPQLQESPEPNCMAYEIVCDRGPIDDMKPAKGKFTPLGGSVLDAIRDQASKDGIRIGVLIIDVQTNDKRGALDEASRVGNGLHVKYDSRSVLQNQADVVGLAAELKIPIFNVTSAASDGSVRTVNELTSKFPKEDANVHSYRKTDNNVMGQLDRSGEPVFLKTLKEQMGVDGDRYLVVMGFNANQCVQGSVFGNSGKKDYKNVYGEDEKGYPKARGLLECGFTIITSRTILASSNAVLEAAWGPLREES